MLLYYLLFEESSTDCELMEKALRNISDSDYTKLIYFLPREWTDIAPQDCFTPLVEVQKDLSIQKGSFQRPEHNLSKPVSDSSV